MTEYSKVKNAAETYLLRKMSDDMTSEETDEFEAWLDASPLHKWSYQKAESSWEKNNVPEESLPDQSANADGETDDKSGSQNLFQRALYGLFAFCKTYKETVAAVFVTFTVFTYAFGENLWMMANADMITSAGEQHQIKLDDGSLVFLNTDTAIALNFTKEQRRIDLLKGEIYIDVHPNPKRPFVVETGSGLARALGTAFSVSKKTNLVQVIVTHGRVAVIPNDKRKNQTATEFRLGINETVKIVGGNIVDPAHTIKTEKALAWRQGKIIFEDTEFSQVIKELERYYPGKIVVAEIKTRSGLVTGVFDKDNITEAITSVAQSQGLSTMEVPGGFLIVLH